MKFLSNLFNEENNYPHYWNQYAKAFVDEDLPAFHKAEFVVFDTETTGLNVHKDRVLNIGAVTVRNSTIDVKSSFEIFLKQERFTAHTVPIHGITQNDLRAEYSEQQAVELFLDYIGNKILVGHHLYFDLRMINHMLLRQNLPELKNKCIDTEKLYKATRIRSAIVDSDSSLDAIAENYRLDVSDRHTAAGDALLTALIFLRTVKEIRSEKNYSLKKIVKKFS